MPGARSRRRVTERLLDWYRAQRRELPWRSTRDPYAIWVSEVMLQQTQVATARGYYQRWLERFPDIDALAAADEADVLHAWQGLGYYSRARSLLRAAREVNQRFAGQLPRSVAELRELPGIGRYSAGAIASIAFDVPAAAVDGNVIRVLTRLFALPGDPKQAPLAEFLWQLAASLVPERTPGDFNQALMELGATICLPRTPDCQSCPLRRQCRAHLAGNAAGFPQASKRPRVVQQRHVAAVVLRRGRVLLAQLGQAARRWRGMWQFPCAEADPDESVAAATRRILDHGLRVSATPGERMTVVEHSVTRYRIRLEAYWCRSPTGRLRPRGDYVRAAWFTPREFDTLALPAAHRRLADAAQRNLELGSPKQGGGSQ